MYLHFILATLPAAPHGLKEGVRCVLAFSDPQFSFFILCLKCPPNFFLQGEDARENTLAEVKGGGVLGGEGEYCEVWRVLQL